MADPVIKDVLFDALELPLGEREQFIWKACDGDEEKASAVWRLVRAHDAAGEFLGDPELARDETPVSSGGAPAAATPSIPSMIGPYEVERRLGEGGFGTVYLARQRGAIERLVAIKLIRAGMDSRAMLSRFEQERRALAIMDHPGIARVFDAGTSDDGRPYVVMEHVEGLPITDYCERHKLSITERLELFIGVCHAVQHAHHKGVIHRDLKPANVLVAMESGRPMPKVIDFGIAKALDPTDDVRSVVTMEGQLVGTPQYMSPEQASLDADIDTRSDVYSLGVLLYEMLTSVTPLEMTGVTPAHIGELHRLIREVDPQRPSTRVGQLGGGLATIAERRGVHAWRLGKDLRGDLDWIVMCAIEKDRARRYPTPNAFADDIQRHLRADAVQAGPPSRVYRLSRMVRRHRTSLTIASVIAIALVATAVFSLIFAAEADHARAQAVEARGQAEQELERAEEATRFAKSMLAGVDPAVARGADTALFKSILDNAAARIESEVEHPIVEAEMRLLVGTALMSLNEDDDALRQFEQAVARGAVALGPDHPRVLDAQGNMVKVLAKQSKYQEALAISRRLAVRYEEAFGAEDPSTLSIRSDLATLLSRLGEWDEAGRELEAVYEARSRVKGVTDRSTLTTLGNLASLRVKSGQRDEARALFAELLERQLEIWDEDHPLVLTTKGNLAFLLNEVGEYEQAEPIARDVLTRRERVLGPAHQSTLLAMSNLASLLKATDRPDEAAALYQDGLARARAGLGESHEVTFTFMANLGDLHRRAGRFDEALELQMALRERLAGASGLGGPKASLFTLALANTLLDMERFQDAEETAREAMRLAEAAYPPDNWRHASFRATIGKALMGQSRYADAAPFLTRAHEVFTRDFGLDSVRAIDAAQSLERLFEAAGDSETAAVWAARANP